MSNAQIKLSKKLREIACDLDKVIEDVSGEKHGFLLMIFTEGRAQYVSNCSRKDSVSQIKNLLDLWEKGMPDIQAHKIS